MHDCAAESCHEHDGSKVTVHCGIRTPEQARESIDDALVLLMGCKSSQDDRVTENYAHRGSSTDTQVYDSLEERVALKRWRRLGLRLVQNHLDPCQLVLSSCYDDGVLRIELVVDRCLRHSELFGDHLQRRTTNSMLCKQLQ